MIIKVFVQRKILSEVTALGAHIYTHTRAYNYSQFTTKLNRINRDLRRRKIAERNRIRGRSVTFFFLFLFLNQKATEEEGGREREFNSRERERVKSSRENMKCSLVRMNCIYMYIHRIDCEHHTPLTIFDYRLSH